MKKAILLFIVIGVLGFVAACGDPNPTPELGQNLAVLKGCSACHSSDATTKIAPPWSGLYASQVELNDGTLVLVDDAYLIESIKDPNAKIVNGYTRGAMPIITLTDQEIAALVAYIKSLD